jgi:hypothetical protein
MNIQTAFVSGLVLASASASATVMWKINSLQRSSACRARALWWDFAAAPRTGFSVSAHTPRAAAADA